MEENVEYGYIENGTLHSRFLAPYVESKTDSDGVTISTTVTVEEQVAMLSSEWKPVDTISLDMLQSSDDEDYVVVPRPYDAGDHIAYNYVKKFDKRRVRDRIAELQDALSASDYKVSKCYEASLLGNTLPYDMETLHSERQAQRDEVNTLQEKLENCPTETIIL